ncbi:extradiol dioxygenase [Aciditerrimonas ferrireducens]|uniref:Extradiol dioxygenase n=1 Tax=Aciditerrimonas ferrireducens TaxID=667306 RepID=A0ABV6C055_9ACTN
MSSHLVAGACVSHSPGLTGFPERAPAADREAVLGAFEDMAGRIRAARPDALVMVSSEHFTNFSPANLPTVAVGMAEEYACPASEGFERFLRVPRRGYPGQAALGRALAEGLLERGFDPALVGGGYGFDEAFAVPLSLLVDPADPVPVVPVVVNAVQAPMPSLARCAALGRAVGDVIAGQEAAARVAVVASGGLSHWVGLPRAGEIDQAFDELVLGLLEKGDVEELAKLSEARVAEAGNGAAEVRAWVVAGAALAGWRWEVLAYRAVPPWLTGTAVVSARRPGGESEEEGR